MEILSRLAYLCPSLPSTVACIIHSYIGVCAVCAISQEYAQGNWCPCTGTVFPSDHEFVTSEAGRIVANTEGALGYYEVSALTQDNLRLPFDFVKNTWSGRPDR